MALGASGHAVFRELVGGAVRVAIIGGLVGVLLAGAASRAIASLLYGISPVDPLTFAAVAALLLLATIGAGYAAARSGLRANPMAVLRCNRSVAL